LIQFFYNNKMANIYKSTYDPRQDSGTSGAEVSDLRPDQAYNTDLRRLDPEERASVANINNQQDRVAKFMRAARTAGAYQQRASIDEPTIRGRVPRNPATIQGTEIPSLGDSGGRTGSVKYARRPTPSFGSNL
jgi:hypothetical protein